MYIYMCPPSLFQDEADVMLFCCLVESGVGDYVGVRFHSDHKTTTNVC